MVKKMGNKKKLIRQMQAKTGASYVSAKGMVESKQPPSREIELTIRRVLELAERRHEEHDQRELSRGFGSKPFRDFDDFMAREPADFALREYLRSLSWRQVRAVQIVMYAGRDEEAVADVSESLILESASIIASMVGSKMPLAEYLANGLERARDERFDLEGWSYVGE